MFKARFQELEEAVLSCSYVLKNKEIGEKEALYATYEMIEETIRDKGIVYVIGNGGSAGIASHFSCDLIKSLQIPSQTLYDSNLVTCLANDIGYENVFSYPLQKYLKPQDLLVAISSSGKSPNIVQAAKTALEIGARVITFSGFLADNPLRKLGQLNFWVNRCDYGLIETAHFFLLHTLIDLWNKRTSQDKEYAEIIRKLNTKQNKISC